MSGRERVLKAFGKSEGLPDRVPFQFDLCRSLTEEFGRRRGKTPEYALSYYEDLTEYQPTQSVRPSARTASWSGPPFHSATRQLRRGPALRSTSSACG